MQLDSLSISHVRNLHTVQLDLNPHFNLFYGENGGGKTSILEAIHILALGRSFRATHSKQVITFGEKSCLVTGIASSNHIGSEVSPIRLGVERFQNGEVKIRLAEKDCSSVALLAKTLPVQLINTDSYELLRASPQGRRHFLDWMVFHVEQHFHSTWQRFKRALQQRNAALREKKLALSSEIRIWDKELTEMGETIDSVRKGMLKAFVPLFTTLLEQLFFFKRELSISYQSGWDSNVSLSEALETSLRRDQAWGYTTVGPHRADMEFLLDGIPAKTILSRGQLKLFVCGLLIARALLLQAYQNQSCIFLIDDLTSELDRQASALLIKLLSRINCQVFITSIEADSVVALLEKEDYCLYQVQQGVIHKS